MGFLDVMYMPFLHPWTLIMSMAVFFLLGWVWYSPTSPTGKLWFDALPHLKTEKQPQWAEMVPMMLFQLFLSFVFAHTVMTLWILLRRFGFDDFFATLFLIKMYMGFVFIKDLGHWFFEKRPFSLILVGVGYWLVGIIFTCILLSFIF